MYKKLCSPRNAIARQLNCFHLGEINCLSSNFCAQSSCQNISSNNAFSMYFSHVTRKCNKASSLHLVCSVFIILRVLSFFNSKLNMLWFNFIVGIYKAGFILLCFFDMMIGKMI